MPETVALGVDVRGTKVTAGPPDAFPRQGLRLGFSGNSGLNGVLRRPFAEISFPERAQSGRMLGKVVHSLIRFQVRGLQRAAAEVSNR